MSSIKSRKNRRKPLALSLLLIVALIVPQVAFAMGGGDAAVSNGSATIAAVSGVENVEGGQVDVSENRAMDATPSDVGAQGAASSENTDSAKPSGERAPDGIRNDGVIQNGGGAQDGGKGHDGSGALDSTGTSASFPSRGIGPLSEVGDVGLATFTIASSSTTAASSISAGYTTSQSTTDQLTVRATYVITAPVEAIDAKVEIKLSNVDDEGYFERAPWNGNHVYFRIDEAGIGWPTAAQNRKVEVDGDDITVSFTVSDTEGSTGTITLPYNFNGSTFGGWLPKEKTIARVITGGDIAAPKALTALASPNVGRSLIFNASPNTTEINLGQARRLDLSVSQYGATSPWLSEPGTSYTMTLTYPRNATLVIPDKPYYGLADYSIDESDPDTNTVTWDLGNVGQDGVASGSEWYRSGTYLYAGYSMPGFNITFPSGVYKNGDSVTLCATLTSTYAGAATPTTTTNTKTFKLVDQAQVHMNPIASFNFSTRLYLKKGDGSAYSYFPYSAQNSGTAPVPEAHYTWYNDVDKTGKKLNVSRVTVANIGVRFQAKLVYYIAGPGGGRQAIYYLPAAANAGTTNQPYADTSAVPGATLGAGEYIDRIEAWPLGNGITETVTSANEDRALPTGASMRFTLSFLNWPGDAYPDGRAVKNNDFVMTKADLEWKGERRADLHTGNYVAGKQKDADDSYTMKLSTLNSESYSRAYFVDNPVIPSVQWQYQRGQEGIKNPGTEIGMNLRFYSLSWSYANNPWKNPILYYLPPNAIEIDTTQTLNVFNGNADGTGAPVATASIEKTTVQGKRAYKIEMNKPMTLAATTATSVNAKFIPITVKLREDATSGNIYFNHTNGTGYPDTSGLLFGVSEASPFTIPANYGTFYQDTNDLDGNPNTPILVSTTSPLLNVTQLDGMSVIAEMLNNRLGDTPVWQNVNITGAEATVATNAGGEGKFSLTLKNNGNSYLGGIRLLDILPFVGDKTVCTPTQPKGSQWAAVLKEKLDVKVFDSENKDVTSQFSGAYTISYGTKGDPDYDGGSGGIVRSGSDGAFSGSTA
ncbi:MAG: hypothetical protein LBK04_06110, partial [Clostridiales Family XIII bacterium]|nr:hypothetical protein [Clostridiales Family XIII bacterium]